MATKADGRYKLTQEMFNELPEGTVFRLASDGSLYKKSNRGFSKCDECGGYAAYGTGPNRSRSIMVEPADRWTAAKPGLWLLPVDQAEMEASFAAARQRRADAAAMRKREAEDLRAAQLAQAAQHALGWFVVQTSHGVYAIATGEKHQYGNDYSGVVARGMDEATANLIWNATKEAK